MIDPTKILSARFRFSSWIVGVTLLAYFCASFCLYFQWVAPSLNGDSQVHIGADSATYIGFAESLRSGRPDPLVIAALSTFPNTLWSPVLIALVLKSTFAMVVANYVAFIAAILLLKKSFSFSMSGFLMLMLLNATTTVSLLSVNKEIIDLLVVSIFLFGYRRHRTSVILLALFLALLNRFELALVMLLFLAAQSSFNPLRRRRVATLVVLTLFLSVMLPLVASQNLANRFEEASAGGVVVVLDGLEMHYLFAVSVIPKVAENFFGMLMNPSSWGAFSESLDIANSYVLVSNNLATLFVVIVLASRRSFATRSEIMYFAFFGCIIMSISLVIQPRYFYFVYVLLCLQAAHPKRSRSAVGVPSDHQLEGAHG